MYVIVCPPRSTHFLLQNIMMLRLYVFIPSLLRAFVQVFFFCFSFISSQRPYNRMTSSKELQDILWDRYGPPSMLFVVWCGLGVQYLHAPYVTDFAALRSCFRYAAVDIHLSTRVAGEVFCGVWRCVQLLCVDYSAYTLCPSLQPIARLHRSASSNGCVPLAATFVPQWVFPLPQLLFTMQHIYRTIRLWGKSEVYGCMPPGLCEMFGVCVGAVRFPIVQPNPDHTCFLQQLQLVCGIMCWRLLLLGPQGVFGGCCHATQCLLFFKDPTGEFFASRHRKRNVSEQLSDSNQQLSDSNQQLAKVYVGVGVCLHAPHASLMCPTPSPLLPVQTHTAPQENVHLKCREQELEAERNRLMMVVIFSLDFGLCC